MNVIIRATRASYFAIESMNKWQFVMRDMKRTMGTDPIARAKYQQASLNYSKAQQRYRNAQKVLAMNPLPGDPQ